MLEYSEQTAIVPVKVLQKILDLLQLAADRNAFPKIDEYEAIGQVYRQLTECFPKPT